MQTPNFEILILIKTANSVFSNRITSTGVSALDLATGKIYICNINTLNINTSINP